MDIYLDLLNDLLQAPVRGDRTGTGTHSVFGRQFHFRDIALNFPLLTTKKVSLKTIFHELRWMLKGDTNIKYLVDNGVNIWNDWPYKHYCQKVQEPMTQEQFVNQIRHNSSFARQWGDCGPVYGKQWRKWRGSDDVCATEVEIDQIANLLNDLRNNPESRRMIVSAWNVADIPEMIPSGLPPCHLMMQFYTREIPTAVRRNIASERNIYPLDTQLTGAGIPERFLDCQVYIRSNDVFLGMPFNMAQYALLTHLIAKTVNMVPGNLVYTIGDAHLYRNHVEQAKEQLTRFPDLPPQVSILNQRDDPADYEWEDIKLTNYHPHDAIKAPIAV